MLDADVLDGVGEDGEGAVVVRVELAGVGGKWQETARGEGAYFAMLRCTKMSPGREAVMTDSGTRESAQPIQRI